ncbi:MAG TPA: MFS transporter [Methanocorpusculum sp.]|nr:MFS transporter [Methanocorpusculum sp.]
MTTLTKNEIIKTAFIILAAFLAYGLVAGLRATSGVFVSEIANISGISYGSISTVVTIRNLLFAIACPFWGFMTLRKSYTFILTIGLILTALGFAGILVFSSFIGLIIFQGIFFGIGAGALCYSITYAAAASFLTPKTAAVFAGILSMSQGVFNIILAPVVRFSSGFDNGFIVCMVFIAIAIAAIIPLTFFFKWQKNHTNTAAESSADELVSVKSILKTMAKSPFFYLISISYFIYGLCQGGMMNHLLRRGTSMMGLDANGATILVMIYGFALIIGPLLAGIIASRIANKRLALAAMFLAWVIVALISCMIIPGNTIATIVVIVILGVLISMAVPYHALLTRERVPLKSFAATFSIISMFEVFGYAANAFFGGLCFDITGSFLSFDFIVIGLAGAIGIIFGITGFRRRKQLSP